MNNHIKFMTELVVIPSYLGEECWTLANDFIYQGDIKKEITVSKGFKTDFASIPYLLRPFFKKYGKHMRAAVIHDYLYSSKELSRKDADAVFLEAMQHLGVSKWKRWMMYKAVRVAGGSRYET